MKTKLTYIEAEGIFKLKMKNFASAAISFYSVSNDDDEEINLFEEEPFFLPSRTKTSAGEIIQIRSTFAKYNKVEWDLSDIYKSKEVFTALCDLYPDAYIGNIRNQEMMIGNFVSLTRSLSLYFPDYFIEEFDALIEQQAEETGETTDSDELYDIQGTIFTTYSHIDADTDDVLAITLTVVVEYEGFLYAINFDFNRGLNIYSVEGGLSQIEIVEAASTTKAKRLGAEYLSSIVRKVASDDSIYIHNLSTSYVSVFNKNDYKHYNFIYAMNNLFVSTIVDTPSIYRALKPMDYFVITDIGVSITGDVLTTDNHCLVEFLEDNNFDNAEGLVEHLSEFGDGLLRVLVTFDKCDFYEVEEGENEEADFLEQDLGEYSNKILDKYMGLTFTDSAPQSLDTYVEEHYSGLSKLIGNPKNLKDRSFLELEDTPLVESPHLIVRDITDIPVWVYLVAIPYVLSICNELDDEDLMELAEFEDSGMEGHPKFMETVYAVKRLLDKPWN